MVHVVDTATQVLHEVRTRFLTPCEVQKPAQSARYFRPLRGNKGLTDGRTHPQTYISACTDIVIDLNRREWVLREASTSRPLSGPSNDAMRACKEGDFTLLGWTVTLAGRWRRRGGPGDWRNTTELATVEDSDNNNNTSEVTRSLVSSAGIVLEWFGAWGWF